MSNRNLYEILGVERNAAQADVRRAYLRLCKVAHPDVGGNAALFGMITEAYQVLSDPSRRSEYDRGLESPGRQDASGPSPHGAGNPSRDTEEQRAPTTTASRPTAPSRGRRPPPGGPGRYTAAGVLVVWAAQFATWLPVSSWHIPTLAYPTAPDLVSAFNGAVAGLTVYGIARPRPVFAFLAGVDVRKLAVALASWWIVAIFLGWMLIPAGLASFLLHHHIRNNPANYPRLRRLASLWRRRSAAKQ